MKIIQLLERLEFHDGKLNASPLHRSKESQVFRFMLKPGQEVSKHNTPDLYSTSNCIDRSKLICWRKWSRTTVWTKYIANI